MEPLEGLKNTLDPDAMHDEGSLTARIIEAGSPMPKLQVVFVPNMAETSDIIVWTWTLLPMDH